MRAEKGRDLAERFLALRQSVVEFVLGVRHALEHLKIGLDSRAAQFAMDANRVAQQEVARASGQDGRREPMHVAVDRRDQRILEVVSAGVNDGRRIAESIAGHENVVDLLVRIEAVAGLGGV